MAMIKCSIVSAEESLFTGTVKRVVAHGSMGDLGILPNHAPLLTSLLPGPVRVVKEDDTEEIFYISGGFLEVQPLEVVVLADTGIRAEDLDEAAAKAAMISAEHELNDKSSHQDYSKTASSLAQAAAQLRTITELRRKFK
ncbi:F0F1 ATP synthase subunit epsilon [Entomomonas asaccharolytica]|uniref:ATP synthase epsilon chain n=1 Tax=Entomomonas asaccharolytica TaxID=2785331 RepID=A0A974NFB9_9GAMM|nr:F0F1 ATP synthase subunit epsilon [Entomomonas asaccharolytica]QQP85648.1 F0F1 ATP synthase subunit epsilon [Entomomonas asaccharolytica]